MHSVSLSAVSGILKLCQPLRTCLRSVANFEPPYLDAHGIQIPEYPLVNICMKGYDFTILEHYQKWVHRIAVNLGLDIKDCWCTPCKKLKAHTFFPVSTKVKEEFLLQIYERNVQIADMPSTIVPVLIDIIQAGLPEGVEFALLEHMPEYTEFRYIPDLELKDLRRQLDEMGGPSKPPTKQKR